MKNRIKKYIFWAVCSTAFLIVGCKSTYVSRPFEEKDIPWKPNYNQEYAWAVLPNKIPEKLKKHIPSNYQNLQADVFYIYPTLNSEYNDIRWNVAISDSIQNHKIVNIAVYNQASPFVTSGKLYVPRYRQAHIRSFRKNFAKVGEIALKLAYSDVKDAFKIYLKKYNNDRPIIIAAHSQGTHHAVQLIKDFFDEKPLQKQLIAAYIPGMRVKPDEFKSIKPMTKPNETGGFVSWNTFKKGHFPKRDKDWYKGGVTTNPITWNTDRTTSLKQHKGFLYSNDKLYKNALKIEITDGLVWSTNPKFPMRFFMSFMKNYHIGDINLFWQDIKENVELRTKTFFENKK